MAQIPQVSQTFDCKTATREQFTSHVRKLMALIDDLTKQLEEAADIVADYYWLRQVRQNKTMTQSSKLILEALPEILATKTPDEDGFSRVRVKELADATGQSRSTISKQVARLDDSGIVGYKLEHSEDGLYSEMYLQMFPQTRANPAPLVLLPEINKKTGERKGTHGGMRVKMCKHCHGVDIRVVCAGCGQTLQDDEVIEMSAMEYQAQIAHDEEMREIEAQKEAAAAAAGYPHEQKQLLDAQEKRAPSYACFECETVNWLPALEGEQWGYKCGTCRPFLMISAGRDLRKREGINE